MNEREFQRAVIEVAHSFGWKVAHFRTAMNARGVHMTPVAADGKGWPDLVLVHPQQGVALFRELKSADGRLSAEQARWLADLNAAGLDAGVWRPIHMSQIVAQPSFGRATISA